MSVAVAASAPREMAIPGTHERVLRVVREFVPVRTAGGSAARVLDIGAGQGALSARLAGLGYEVRACDLFPEQFRAAGIECLGVDASGRLPYADGTFDAAVAVEVVEHLESHRGLFTEAARVLRPGGVLLFSTPNIASLKSRWMFLLTGYMYSFGPLDPEVEDPVHQHIAPFTPDRHRFMLARAGLGLEALRMDKAQGTSRALSWMAPMVRGLARLKWGSARERSLIGLQNSREALLGRKLVVVARRPQQGAGA